jgi:hypothetical protein
MAITRNEVHTPAVRFAAALLLTAVASVAIAAGSEPILIAGHVAQFDAAGKLLPWIDWATALERELQYYREAPLDHGYPRFVTETFLEGDWTPDPARRDTIPATQNGMGIISYLKLYARADPDADRELAIARTMGDYLLNESLTPDQGSYPHFTRSTGTRGQFPLAADAGSESDRAFEIEPDKGGLAGYALLLLYGVTHEAPYRDQALHNARLLAAHQQPGDAARSPWPFRADYRTGLGRGAVSGNMTYILRLYDALLVQGYLEFRAPRRSLWRWIKHYQIPSAAHQGLLFAQFFEDHDAPTNRNAWAPLNLARYLLEQRAALDPDWRADAGVLIQFVRRTFTHQEFGVTVCHEQDEDHEAWGGVNATYGAVLALYAKATQSEALADEAWRALNFTLYNIDDDGRPRDLYKHPAAGGWQEDAHTDVLHNFLDALQAYPSWAHATDALPTPAVLRP